MILSGYILSIVGVVILGVIIDLMMAEGQMQKYIKNIFVIFVIFAIISPIPNLLKTNIALPTINSEELSIDKDLLKNINSYKKEQLENDIIQHFKDNGVSGVQVEVEIDAEYQEFLPKKILLNIKNLVIENNYLNINKYGFLENLILDVVQVERGIIEFYE